jgi:pimeloyl-ACP methyl ester carboxylesterase
MLERIATPTLLVRGAESDILAAETAQKMTEVMPNCTLVTVPDAGHSIPLDNPQGFIDAVRPFLLGE